MELDNERKYVRAQSLILATLETGSRMGFNELEKGAGVSSRTLAKHLRVLVPEIVEKVGEKYALTNVGRRRLESIRHQIEDWSKYSPRDVPPEKIEVYMVGRAYSCRSVLTVVSSRALHPEQRMRLDRAMTDLIKSIKQSIPAGSNWKVSTVWQSKR